MAYVAAADARKQIEFVHLRAEYCYIPDKPVSPDAVNVMIHFRAREKLAGLRESPFSQST